MLNKTQNKGRKPAGIYSKSEFFFNSFLYEPMVIWDTSRNWGQEKANILFFFNNNQQLGPQEFWELFEIILNIKKMIEIIFLKNFRIFNKVKIAQNTSFLQVSRLKKKGPRGLPPPPSKQAKKLTMAHAPFGEQVAHAPFGE